MTKKAITTSLNCLFICLLFIIQLLPAGMAAEEIRADYSGWSLSDAFADLAMKAGINLVCAFPDQKNGYFRLNETVYFEEAMSLLANINRMQVRRNDNIWVITPEDAQPKSDRQAVTIRDLSFRQLSELGNQMELMKMPQVSLWFPPHSRLMAAVGPKVGLDEIKKLKETLDTPVHALQIAFYLKKISGETIASCTFNGVSNQTFSLTFVSESGKERISIAGTPSLNDDGKIRFAFSEKFVSSEARLQKSDSIFLQYQKPAEHRINLAGTEWLIGWQMTPAQLYGRLAPENAGHNNGIATTPSDEKQSENDQSLRPVDRE